MNETVSLTTLDKTRELSSPILSSMRDRIIPLYDKGAEEIGRYAGKAAAVVDRYNRAVALELAALPVDDKGKLDESKFDGFKSPVEVATALYGFKQKFAYTLLDYGRKCLSDKTPKQFQELTPSNAAVLAGAKESDVKAALESGEISSKTTQKELKDWAAKHRKTETKTGKPRVVTTYTVYKGGTMVKAPHGEVTEDEFKKAFPEDYTVLFMDSYSFSPDDAPKRKLTVRRYVAVSPELNAEVFTLIPTYQNDTDKPEHIQRAEEFENGMIRKFMKSHPGATREDAIATLQELGMM